MTAPAATTFYLLDSCDLGDTSGAVFTANANAATDYAINDPGGGYGFGFDLYDVSGAGGTFGGFTGAGNSVALSLTEVCIRDVVKYGVFPLASAESLFSVADAAGSTIVDFQLDPANPGKLTIVDSSFSPVAAINDFAASTAHEMQTYLVANGGNWDVEVYRWGLLVYSGTILGTGSNVGNYSRGAPSGGNGELVYPRYDHLAISNGVIPTNTVLRRAMPSSDYNLIAYGIGTPVGKPQRYRAIRSVPPTTSVYVEASETGSYLATVAPPPECGIRGRVLAVMQGYAAFEPSSVTSSATSQLDQNSSISATSSLNLSTTMRGRYKVLSTNPNTAKPWTDQNALNQMRIGFGSGNTATIRVAQVGVVVAYVPNGPAGYTIVNQRDDRRKRR